MSRLLAPFVIWKVAAFGLLVGRSKWLSVGEEQEPQRRRKEASCKLQRGERGALQFVSEAPRPVAWRQRAQQMVHNLISQPGTSLPSLGSGRGLAGPLSSHPLLVLEGGVPGKGLALLNQLCTEAAGSDPTAAKSKLW